MSGRVHTEGNSHGLSREELDVATWLDPPSCSSPAIIPRGSWLSNTQTRSWLQENVARCISWGAEDMYAGMPRHTIHSLLLEEIY